MRRHQRGLSGLRGTGDVPTGPGTHSVRRTNGELSPGAKLRTVWCSGPSWDGSWSRPQVRREAVAGGGSVQARGAPQKSGKKSRGREEGIQMGDSDAPQTSLSCMSSGTPGRADFTLSQGMKRSPRDTRDFLLTEERDLSRVPSLGSPYIDAAQVEPLLKAE